MTTTQQLWDWAPGTEVDEGVYDAMRDARRETASCLEHIRHTTWEDEGGEGQRPGLGGAWSCSLPRHDHFQPHIAMSHTNVLAKWGVYEEPETTTDPVVPFTPEVGVLYRFRNRDTMLLYVAARKDGRVDVLDLEHSRYRVLRREQLALRRDTDPDPTPQQMQWVATFMSERRATVRATALEQKRAGYFRSMDDLNNVLKELHLAPVQMRYTGFYTPEISIRSRPGMTRAQVEEAMRAWFATTPMPDGIEMTRSNHRFGLDETAES